MKLSILYDQYNHFLELFVAEKTLRESLDSLPDDLELTVSFEKSKDQPGGMIKDGQIMLSQPKKPKTVAQRKEELDRDIRIISARVKQLKAEMIKELQKEE